MLEPISNQMAAKALRLKEAAERARRARDSDGRAGPVREGDSFDSALESVEPAEAVRKLADADQEEAREDRQASQRRPAARGPDQDHTGPSLDLSA